MAANLRGPSSIPGGDPKRFQDTSNYVFYIVGECFSGGAGTHLAKDLTDKENNDFAGQIRGQMKAFSGATVRDIG